MTLGLVLRIARRLLSLFLCRAKALEPCLRPLDGGPGTVQEGIAPFQSSHLTGKRLLNAVRRVSGFSVAGPVTLVKHTLTGRGVELASIGHDVTLVRGALAFVGGQLALGYHAFTLVQAIASVRQAAFKMRESRLPRVEQPLARIEITLSNIEMMVARVPLIIWKHA
ncbi:hypothetical protein [Micromonospora sp. NPDC049679]|uniref:hypothetical protein n=1 Tax=Micromonospora sp. NPDC049679 TaxID=3155920 RepID=UPI003407F0D9